ncbi:MAG TPA: extracellular solute-binding protein [Phycisphaerae bacterium]|nr:extracellular solute-binding protein [Phycisphaerae bacterium]
MFSGGCRRQPAGREVALYTSVDEPFARQVVAEFERQTGITVRVQMDTESGKTTGLVRRIRAEQGRPRADVFWSSELFNTIKLAREGLLAEYRPPAEGIPDRYKDPDGRWTAFGVRARVIGYNTEAVGRDEVPSTWRAIVDPRWKGKLGVADPQFGTTGGHFAAMWVLWGEQEYCRWLDALKEVTGGQLQDGNATAARRVGSGELSICATDTDDVYARQERGEPVDLVYPDMGDGGTLLIPNSVGLVTGAPHAETARKLIDFLTSEVTERLLAESESRNIPVRPSLQKELELVFPPETQVSFDAIAEAFDRAIRLAGQHLKR